MLFQLVGPVVMRKSWPEPVGVARVSPKYSVSTEFGPPIRRSYQDVAIDPSDRTLTAGRKCSANELSSFTFAIGPVMRRSIGRPRSQMSPSGWALASFHPTTTFPSGASTAMRGKSWPRPRLYPAMATLPRDFTPPAGLLLTCPVVTTCGSAGPPTSGVLCPAGTRATWM